MLIAFRVWSCGQLKTLKKQSNENERLKAASGDTLFFSFHFQEQTLRNEKQLKWTLLVIRNSNSN